MPLENIAVVLFDVYDTLIRRRNTDMEHLLALRPGIEGPDAGLAREADAAAMDYYRRERHQSWAIADVHSFWTAYYAIFLNHLGIEDQSGETAAALARLARSPASYLITDGVFSVLEQLHHRGYRLGLLSNFDTSLPAFCCELGFGDYHLDLVLASDEIGIRKPSPDIFLEGCRRLGVEPHRCLYVGDSFEKDVVGAANAGLNAVWFNWRARKFPRNRENGHWLVIEKLTDVLTLVP